MFKFFETVAPGITDIFMSKAMMEKGQSDPKLDGAENKEALHAHPRREGAVRGSYPGHVFETSAATSAQLHPAAATLLAAGVGLAAAAGISFLMNQNAKGKGLGFAGLRDGVNGLVGGLGAMGGLGGTGVGGTGGKRKVNRDAIDTQAQEADDLFPNLKPSDLSSKIDTASLGGETLGSPTLGADGFSGGADSTGGLKH
ncbi:MAG: hypothetical protein EOP17_23175 [Rhizobiaceae bacterium]|nr:MAG: hypothetical protein EOP17_23175 [Rhizobiaceae bacterium]